MLCYDSWDEDVLGYEDTCYRIVPFPTPAEAHFGSNVASFTRQSNLTRWQVFGFSFLQINNNPRCPLPLQVTDYPSDSAGQAHSDAFDITFNLPGNTCVRYSGACPTQASPALTLDSTGAGTLHIDSDTVLNFRTYHDATPPDGYLASDVVTPQSATSSGECIPAYEKRPPLEPFLGQTGRRSRCGQGFLANKRDY